MKTPSMTVVLLVCVLCSVRCFALAPETESSVPLQGENLGESLLDDELDRLLLQELENELAKGQLQGPLPDGDDVGQSSGAAALEAIRQKMQAASELLSQPNKLKRTQSLQQQAIAELDRLIQEAEQKERKSSGKKKPGTQQKPSQKKSTGMTAGQAPKSQATDPKRSSNQTVTRTDRYGNLIKQAWGNLPERTRQQMLQSMEQDFLPKYQSELQEYFKSLSTDGGGSSND